MKKNKSRSIFAIFVSSSVTALLFLGCTKDSIDSASGCYKVRLGPQYCSPPSYSVLVYFDKPNPYSTTEYDQDEKPSRYTAAVSNFPIALHKRDSVVYIKFHYSAAKDREYKQSPCAAIFSSTKYVMLDEISTRSCDLTSKPQ
jgi:hypothetical protein